MTAGTRTELAESGAGDQTIMNIAGHVSKQMLKHYSHIRMEAERDALESLVEKRAAAAVEEKASHQCAESPMNTQEFAGEYPQKSPQSGIFGGIGPFIVTASC